MKIRHENFADVDKSFTNTSRIGTFCLPNLHLLGVRKCGTTDLLKWFSAQKQVATSLRVSSWSAVTCVQVLNVYCKYPWHSISHRAGTLSNIVRVL